ncbi:MAG TPA: sigma-54 dependent transcriptional regulator [Polyangiaceae bacterium]|nr:sigma-54 dependent transcriptional regulator [Polyangiaceae bacterium]
MTTRILLVDDDATLADTLGLGLRKRGFDVAPLTSAAAALQALDGDDFDVVVTDLNMGGMGGIELCEHVAANRPDLPVVVLTAFGNLESAIAAIRVGAYDFINKPVELDVLAIAVERAATHRQLREEVKRLRLETGKVPRFDALVGHSGAMQVVYDLIERVAASDATVLVSGESGTGKEVVARAIHTHSRRRAGPFVAINCAAMPETLLESELFGHAKGAFTDARTSEPGLFHRANRGTIFLDEIGDMPLGLQPKLLRVLQERTVRPVGGRDEIPIDVRVIAATNRDLEFAVEETRFRADLYYRINVVHVALPPLRARVGDILPLAQHFLLLFASRSGKQITGIAAPAAEKIIAYAWPGNVRELQNCMERAVALTRLDQIVVDDLPEKVRDYRRSHVLVASDDPSELVPLEEVERRYIARVMEAVGGNKTAASRVLGIDRKRLYRMLERLDVDVSKTD